MHGNKTMTTTTKQTPHSRITDRARYRLPASTTVDPTAHKSQRSPRTTEDQTRHSRKFKHAPQIWPTQRQDPPCTMAKQSNATAEWKNMTVDPTTHGTNRARATSDRTTHDGKTKQTRSQRRPPKSQSRSKTVANRPRNRRSKHAQSPTLPPHATAAPNTK